MVYCELNTDNQKYINEKAKTKNDGIYTARGIYYLVKNKKVVAFACKGEVIQQYGIFNTVIGKYNDSAKEILRTLL